MPAAIIKFFMLILKVAGISVPADGSVCGKLSDVD